MVAMAHQIASSAVLMFAPSTVSKCKIAMLQNTTKSSAAKLAARNALGMRCRMTNVASTLVARYQRIDDFLWARWKTTVAQQLPGAVHQDRANTVRFASRPISPELTPQLAFDDVKMVLEFVVGSDAVLAEAVGVGPIPGDQTD